MFEMGQLNGSANEPCVEFYAPCCTVVGCEVVAGDITASGIEGLVHEQQYAVRTTCHLQLIFLLAASPPL